MTSDQAPSTDTLYAEVAARFGPALARLSRAVERDAERARDLEQDIHLALWRSLAGFAGACSLSTWTYRVAHNVAASYAARGARDAKPVPLEDADALATDDDPERAASEAQALARLHQLIRALDQPDRSVMLLYLEGLDAAAIGDVTGLSATNVGVKVHRMKALLGRRFTTGEPR